MPSDLPEHIDDNLFPEMIKIEGGSFMMGSEKVLNEQPVHEVHVPDFYLGKYPVTVKPYLEFVQEMGTHYLEWLEEGNQYNIYTGDDSYYKSLEAVLLEEDHPIVGISWEDAVAYCKWLSEKTRKEYRLPSEAEWEYAARGGRWSNGYTYSGSNKLKEVGWYDKNSHEETKAVGLKLPNELGLYDMSGNVEEWCADHWHKNYEGAPTDGSAWIKGGEKDRRVVRGGSWGSDDLYCRVSFRFWDIASYRDFNIGFRLARY